MSQKEYTHHKHQAPHVRHISEKLQAEVDLILDNVNEKALFAEFREDEIFDIQNGDKQEIIRHTLDERIMMGRNHKYQPLRVRIDEKTTRAVRKMNRFTRFFYYLFKPLEY